MASLDSYNNVYGQLVLPTAAYVADALSAAVDMAGYESLTFFLKTLVVNDGTWVTVLYDSDEVAGIYAPVPTAAVDKSFGVIGTLPTFTAAESNYLFRVGYCGRKRFVKLGVTMRIGGTAEFNVFALKGDPRKGPTPTQVNP